MKNATIYKIVRMAYSGMIRVYRNDKFEYHQYEGWALVPADAKKWADEHGFSEVAGF